MVKIFGKGSDTKSGIVMIEGNKCPSHQKFLKIKSRGIILGFSDGTLLEIQWDQIGGCNINILKQGGAKLDYRKDMCKEEGLQVTDEVVLHGEITWIVCGSNYKMRTSKGVCEPTCQTTSVSTK